MNVPTPSLRAMYSWRGNLPVFNILLPIRGTASFLAVTSVFEFDLFTRNARAR